MATTAQDLINDAGKLNGKIGAGRTLSESEFLDSLHILQRLIDSWSIERLMLYAINRRTYKLIPGKGIYTIGIGPADWLFPRPIRIEGMGLILTSVIPPVETPIRMLTDNEWELKRVKDLVSNLPRECWYNSDWPLGEISFWPVPTEANDIAIYSIEQLAWPFALDTAIDMPPGYEQALIDQLAVQTCTLFQRQITPALLEQARESKARIKRYNHTNDFMRCDRAITGSIQSPGIAQFFSGE